MPDGQDAGVRWLYLAVQTQDVQRQSQLRLRSGLPLPMMRLQPAVRSHSDYCEPQC